MNEVRKKHWMHPVSLRRLKISLITFIKKKTLLLLSYNKMLVGLFNCKNFGWRSMRGKLSQEANKHSTYSWDHNSVWLGIYLTNREAFTRLCSVATHQGSGYSTNGDFCLCSGYSNVNYDAYHIYKPSFGSSVVTFWLSCSEISPRKKSKRSNIEHFRRWRDSFSSALCFKLW